MTFRVLFFGTPEFAVPSLNALCDIAHVVGVVCQPDRPAGRGLAVHPPPVKVRARELGLPVVQPTRLKGEEFFAWVRSQQADVALVVAYGRLLPKEMLGATRLGFINVHASLLPKYRGAAPIAWALVHGETETGITLMKLDEGLDTGDMLESFSTPVGPEETAGELSLRLAELGAKAVITGLPRFVAGQYTPRPQEPKQATFAPLLRKEEGLLDWNQSATHIHNRVRGLHPWPGAFTLLHGKRVKVHSTSVVSGLAVQAPPGQVILADKTHLIAACGQGAIELLSVQLEGKKAMRGTEWAIGRGVQKGDRLGSLEPIDKEVKGEESRP